MRLRLHSFFSLMLITVVAFGCTSWIRYGGGQRIAIPSANADALYAATVRVFVRRGWGIAPHEAASHVVETEYRRWGSAMTGEALISYRVFTRNGEVEVFTSCRRDLGPCPEGERPEGVDASEQELGRDIRAEASSL